MLTHDQKASLRANIVLKAIAHIGNREIGTTNEGPEVNQYLAYVNLPPGLSWCMSFDCYIVGRTAEGMGLSFSDTTLIKTGSCSAQAAHAMAHGSLILDGNISPGDLVVVYEGGDYHHTGIVVIAPDANGVFHTVEGNSNETGAREGTEVCRQTRNANDQNEGRAKYAFLRVV